MREREQRSRHRRPRAHPCFCESDPADVWVRCVTTIHPFSHVGQKYQRSLASGRKQAHESCVHHDMGPSEMLIPSRPSTATLGVPVSGQSRAMRLRSRARRRHLGSSSAVQCAERATQLSCDSRQSNITRPARRSSARTDHSLEIGPCSPRNGRRAASCQVSVSGVPLSNRHLRIAPDGRSHREHEALFLAEYGRL